MKKRIGLKAAAYLNILIIFLCIGINNGCGKNSKIKSHKAQKPEEYLNKEGEDKNSPKIKQKTTKVKESKVAAAKKKAEIKPLVEEKIIPVGFFEKMQGIKNKPLVFSTPYGNIERGVSMIKTIGIFGNPKKITSHNTFEIWYYLFEKNNKIFIKFLDGKVIKVTGRRGE